MIKPNPPTVSSPLGYIGNHIIEHLVLDQVLIPAGWTEETWNEKFV